MGWQGRLFCSLSGLKAANVAVTVGALAQAAAAWPGATGDGRWAIHCTARARGAHNQLGVGICRVEFWRRTFKFASATTGVGWPADGGDESGDASVVDIRLECGKKRGKGRGEAWTGLENLGALAAM